MRSKRLARVPWLAATLMVVSAASVGAQPANRREFIYMGDRLVAIVRPDNPAVVAMVSPALSVNEAAGVVNVGVQVTTAGGVTVNPITVNYGTSDGTATAGVDYTMTSGVLTFGQVLFLLET